MQCFKKKFRWMKMMKCQQETHGRPFWINIAFLDFLHIFLGYLPNPEAKAKSPNIGRGGKHVSQNLSYFQRCWLLVGGFTASVGQCLLFVTSHTCGRYQRPIPPSPAMIVWCLSCRPCDLDLPGM